MSRRLSGFAVAALVGVAGAAQAQPAAGEPDPLPAEAASPAQPAPAPSPPPADSPALAAIDNTIGDQLIAAQIGLVTGGRVTPGGFRIAGHYLYQLSELDWFDGMAAFTFGSGQGACFRDRDDQTICKHGPADGTGIQIAARIRHVFAAPGPLHPFLQGGLGVGFARFSADDLSGFVIPFHAGGGARLQVARSMSLVGEGNLEFGFGSFGAGLGIEPQLALAVTVGVEFQLR
jgi:hypothetical protein